jgi:hypothetical protein
MAHNLAIAQKGRQDFFMPKVLTPGLELFRCLADLLAELKQGISETMGIEHGAFIIGGGEPVLDPAANSILLNSKQLGDLFHRLAAVGRVSWVRCREPVSCKKRALMGSPKDLANSVIPSMPW